MDVPGYLQALSLAEARTDAGQWAQAVTLWQRVTEQNPVNGNHWDRLAQAQYESGDYAAALGATVAHVEHIADAGLLGGGGDTASYQPVRVLAKAFGGSGDQSGTPALTPVPQELIATIEARFRTTDVSLPSA